MHIITVAAEFVLLHYTLGIYIYIVYANWYNTKYIIIIYANYQLLYDIVIHRNVCVINSIIHIYVSRYGNICDLQCKFAVEQRFSER